MKRFQNVIAIFTIAVFSAVGCAVGPSAAKDGGGPGIKTPAATQAAAAQIALAQMILFLLILDYIEKNKKKEESCSKASPAAVSSDFAGNQVLPQADGPAGYAYFDVPWGREYLAYQMSGGRYLTHGDIMFEETSAIQAPFTIADNPFAPQATVYYPGGQWAGRRLYYYYDGTNPADSTMVASAIAHWEQHSNFRFTQVSSSDNSVPKIDFVTGQSGGGCWSYIGRTTTTGSQYINVDNNCGIGATVHEIGHALGLFHEQSRNDRDSHVDVNYSNIQSGYASNYDKAGSSGTDSGPYDFTSIMHYGSYYFAADSNTPVMTKKNGDIIVPNRSALTNCDISGAHLSNPE